MTRRLECWDNHSFLYQYFPVAVCYLPKITLLERWRIFLIIYTQYTQSSTFIQLFGKKKMVVKDNSSITHKKALQQLEWQWKKVWGKAKVSVNSNSFWQASQKLATLNFYFPSVTYSFPSSCAIFPWDSSRLFWVTCNFISMPSCLATILCITEVSI